MKILKFGVFLLLCVFLMFLPASSNDVDLILNEIFTVAAPTGYEASLVAAIQNLLPSDTAFTDDSLGSLYSTRGEGGDHLAVLTGLDEIGYIVSGFDARGYLNLDRVVSVSTPLFDSFQFGHPMVVWTQTGPVPGVLSLPSLHIVSREMRSDLQNVFSLENSLVDIGVRSKADAQARGVAMLDPVTPLARISHLAGDRKSGSSMGSKACVAVLIKVSKDLSSISLGQKTTFIWAAQTRFPTRRSRPRAALGSVVARRNLPAAKFLVVGIYPIENEGKNSISLGGGPVHVIPKGTNPELNKRILEAASDSSVQLQTVDALESMLLAPFLSDKNVSGVFLPVKFPDTPNEVVDFRDVRSLVSLMLTLLQ